jgi:hypothetical protein
MNLNTTSGIVAAVTAAVAIVAALSGIVALLMYVEGAVPGPLNIVIVRAWLDTTKHLLRLPPSALLVGIAAMVGFLRGVRTMNCEQPRQ